MTGLFFSFHETQSVLSWRRHNYLSSFTGFSLLNERRLVDSIRGPLLVCRALIEPNKPLRRLYTQHLDIRTIGLEETLCRVCTTREVSLHGLTEVNIFLCVGKSRSTARSRWTAQLDDTPPGVLLEEGVKYVCPGMNSS